ncbi:MAG: hypothetical protein R6Y91_04735 [Desulfohalobium sp.]
MSKSETEWVILGHQYLQATAGSFLSGVTHNLNNAVHIIDLQLELLQRKLSSHVERGQVESRLDRMGQASHSMGDQLYHLRHRFFYTQVEATQVDFIQYLEWMDTFWNNNLFYKHNIQLEQEIASEVPNLELSPFFLTLCLEEPLKNAVRACRTADLEKQHTLHLSVHPWRSGVRVILDSFEPLPDSLDIWGEGVSTYAGRQGLGLPLINHLSHIVGWEIDLAPTEQGGTRFELCIPEIKTPIPENAALSDLPDW